MRFPSGFSLVKAGEYNRAAKWWVMSPEKADSYQSSFNYESYESATTPAHTREENDTSNLYENIEWVKPDSEDSYSALKRYESANIPDYPTSPCSNCGNNEF